MTISDHSIDSTIIDYLIQRAHNSPDKIAYSYLLSANQERDEISYKDLLWRAQAIAAHLQTLSMENERVLLFLPQGLDFIIAIYGCLLAKSIAVPFYPPVNRRGISMFPYIVQDTGSKVALLDQATFEKVQKKLSAKEESIEISWEVIENIPQNAKENWVQPEITSETLAFLQYTSGTTSDPKGVMVAHGNIIANTKVISEAFSMTDQSISLGWVPLYHDMGMLGHVFSPMYTGAHSILMHPYDLFRDPFFWLNAVSYFKATLSGGPNFVYDLSVQKISEEQVSQLDLSQWDLAYNGAEPVKNSTIEKFVSKFKRAGFQAEKMYPVYGMAEATLMISGGVARRKPEVFQADSNELKKMRATSIKTPSTPITKFVSCGFTRFSHHCTIVNPETKIKCSPGEIGEIWFKGESVTKGYWDKPELSNAVFKAQLKDEGESTFLRTGDLGFLDNGNLYITGRLKDIIIIRGMNVFPQDIELNLEESHEALRKNCCVSFSVEVEDENKLVIVQEVKHTHLNSIDPIKVCQEIITDIVEKHELMVYEVVLVKPAVIPKTSSGKRRRLETKKRYLEDRLELVARWSPLKATGPLDNLDHPLKNLFTQPLNDNF